MDNTSAFRAEDYDKKIRQVLPYYDDFYEQTLDVVRARFQRPVSWLDVGCGTGTMGKWAFSGELAERFVFLDPSAEMLSLARQRFSDRGEYVQGMVQDMNYVNTFDVVTAIQVFHYLRPDERLEAVRRCCRALRPGGVLVTFENFAPDSPEGTRLYLERWRAYQLVNGRTPEACDAHISRYGKDYFPIRISDHLEVLRQGGFDGAEVLWVSNMQAGFVGLR